MIKSWPWMLAIGLIWIIFVPIRLMVPAAWDQAQNAKKATAVTQGKIIAFDPSVHNTATYEFWVNGTRYESSQSGMREGVGSVISIYYDPQNPSVSFANRLPPSFKHNLIGIAILVTVLLVAIVASLFRKPRTLRNNQTQPPPLVHQ